jgi:hypothetical protein
MTPQQQMPQQQQPNHPQQQMPQQQQLNQCSFPPFQQFRHFRRSGADRRSNNSNDDVTFNCSFPTPTHNYAFAAAVLLKTISTNAETIKRWAILDSGATNHFLTTNAPATNICAASIPLVARLPNGDRVQSTHTCTLDLPELPAAARNAHIIPSLHCTPSCPLLQCATLAVLLPSPRLDAPSCIVAALSSVATNARALASGWSRSSRAI